MYFFKTTSSAHNLLAPVATVYNRSLVIDGGKSRIFSYSAHCCHCPDNDLVRSLVQQPMLVLLMPAGRSRMVEELDT